MSRKTLVQLTVKSEFTDFGRLHLWSWCAYSSEEVEDIEQVLEWHVPLEDEVGDKSVDGCSKKEIIYKIKYVNNI